MASTYSGTSSPASTITTTTETLAVNIPASPLTEPGASPQTVIVRGNVLVTTGTGVTAVQVKLRTGQNNTTTAQVSQTEQIQVAASTLEEIPFEFIDAVVSDLTGSGYSITVSQVGATGNGTIQVVNYEIDYSSH